MLITPTMHLVVGTTRPSEAVPVVSFMRFGFKSSSSNGGGGPKSCESSAIDCTPAVAESAAEAVAGGEIALERCVAGRVTRRHHAAHQRFRNAVLSASRKSDACRFVAIERMQTKRQGSQCGACDCRGLIICTTAFQPPQILAAQQSKYAKNMER